MTRRAARSPLALAAAPGRRARKRAATQEAERLAQEAVALAPQDAGGRAAEGAARARAHGRVRADRVRRRRAARARWSRTSSRRRATSTSATARRSTRRSAACSRGRASRCRRAATSAGRSLLDPTPARGLALARSLNELGRGREALDTVQRAIAGLVGLLPEAAEVIVRAADVAGLPSAQAEIDRGRLAAIARRRRSSCGRDRSSCLPGVRLSTNPVFRLDEAAINVVYAAEASCRSCSADLEELARAGAEGRARADPPAGGRPGPGAAPGAGRSTGGRGRCCSGATSRRGSRCRRARC